MKKILFFLLISNYMLSQWSVSNMERSALISLYNSTNGPLWSQNWNFEKDPKTWYGIKVKNGFVSEINLRGNALKGNFPTILSTFTHLEKLDLSNNQLSGEVSADVSGLYHLVRLDISNNRLSGDPALTLGSLSKLEDLSLGNNFFQMNDVNGLLQNFSHIKILDLSSLGLTSIPQKLSTYNGLEILNLSNNNISQNFNAISTLERLRELDVSYNQLTTIPAALSSLTTLTSLNAGGNLFKNNFAAPLSTLKNLEWLSLENNQIESIPAEINQLTKLVHLNLGRNKISGGLNALVSLRNLEQIFLNNNTLSGQFPSELLQLSKLQMLSLSSNQYSGAIPANIPSLTFLENNRFTQAQIQNFLSSNNTFADFVYSPQRYDEEKTVTTIPGGNANLTQSISGEDYSFRWFKNLDQDTYVQAANYYISPVQLEDFAVYTCEAYFVKSFTNYLMEISFFREPITLENGLGTEDISKNLSIYPNPTADFLNIQARNTRLEFSVIFDLSGKKILQTSESRINVKSLPSGVYLITIKTQTGSKTFKWIKI